MKISSYVDRLAEKKVAILYFLLAVLKEICGKNFKILQQYV